MANPVIEALMRAPLFADLDQAELAALAGSMGERSFRAGEIVIAEGAWGDGFFVVDSGEAEVKVQGQPRRRLKPGDCFGEIALLTGSERTATIAAISDIHCYYVTPSNFRQVVEGSPTIAWKLYQSMANWLS